MASRAAVVYGQVSFPKTSTFSDIGIRSFPIFEYGQPLEINNDIKILI